MVSTSKTSTSLELAKLVAKGMAEKKAVDIKILDLRALQNAFTDFFIICSGNSDTQVEVLKDSVEEFVYKNRGEDPWRKEGLENKEWILIDYVDVVAHIFKKDRRTFYGIEELWGDAKVKVWSE